jgi:hypothetical protein
LLVNSPNFKIAYYLSWTCPISPRYIYTWLLLKLFYLLPSWTIICMITIAYLNLILPRWPIIIATHLHNLCLSIICNPHTLLSAWSLGSMKKVLQIKSYLISCEGVTAGFKMLKQTAFNNYIVRRDLYLSTINPILVGYIYCQGMSFA